MMPTYQEIAEDLDLWIGYTGGDRDDFERWSLADRIEILNGAFGEEGTRASFDYEPEAPWEMRHYWPVRRMK